MSANRKKLRGNTDKPKPGIAARSRLCESCKVAPWFLVSPTKAKKTKEREETAMAKKEIPIYDSLPEGWRIKENTNTAPRGYVWIWNVKSHFGGEYRHGLMKIGKEGK